MSNEHNTADVIVIGGGAIGLSCAYALARKRLSVILLERGVCGRESSWAGAGVLQCGNWHRKDPMVRLLRDSLKQYPEFVADLSERTRIDPQFVPCGSFDLLLDDQQYRMAASEAQAAEAYRGAYGRAVLELLSPRQAHELEPHLTPNLLGVKWCPITCQVRNPLLLKAMKAACLLENVRIIEHCPVRGLTLQSGRVTGVHSARGEFSGSRIVLAAGCWSSLLDPLLADSTPVYPVRGQILLLEMAQRPFTRVIEQGKCYLVPRLDGRIVVGATEEHEAGYDKSNTVAGVEHLATLCQKLVPMLGKARVIQAWAGLRPGTPDRRPHLGPVPGIDGLLAATGHFRSGLILAPVTARIIADLIVQGSTEYDLSRFAPGRITGENDSLETR